MKINDHTHRVTVRVVDSIYLDTDEAAFLRAMAEHCIMTQMQGNKACEQLIKVLDAANVPVYGGAPVYGLFEDR